MGVYGQNAVNMMLVVTGIGGARANYFAIFCIHGLDQKNSLYPHTKAFNNAQNI